MFWRAFIKRRCILRSSTIAKVYSLLNPTFWTNSFARLNEQFWLPIWIWISSSRVLRSFHPFFMKFFPPFSCYFWRLFCWSDVFLRKMFDDYTQKFEWQFRQIIVTCWLFFRLWLMGISYKSRWFFILFLILFFIYFKSNLLISSKTAVIERHFSITNLHNTFLINYSQETNVICIWATL